MTITIKIDTGNEAFSDGNKDAEVARIIRKWLDKESMPNDWLYDINGNKVGAVTVRGK